VTLWPRARSSLRSDKGRQPVFTSEEDRETTPDPLIAYFFVFR
jgi:hypothetical protein